MSTPLDKFNITGSRIDGITDRNLSEIIIPSKISEIKESAFSYQSGLERIVISNSVTRIGAKAMLCCTGLKEVILPSNLTRLEDKTFCLCSNLSHLVLPGNLMYIGECAFWATSLVSIVIPPNVTTIEAGAFLDCEKLTSITIPSSVKNFGYSVFDGCKNLTVYTTKGSAAEKYAKSENIPCKYTDDVPVKSNLDIGTSEQVADKGYTCIQLKNNGECYELCKMCYSEKQGIINFYIYYEDGRIYVDLEDGSPQKTIGYYEQHADPVYGAKVFDRSKQRVIGRVGGDQIFFRSQEADPPSGKYLPDEECLAYYTKNGNITALSLLPYWGFFRGTELGGAAAFIAIFYACSFKSVFCDYFEMNSDSFKEKHHEYLK